MIEGTALPTFIHDKEARFESGRILMYEPETAGFVPVKTYETGKDRVNEAPWPGSLATSMEPS